MPVVAGEGSESDDDDGGSTPIIPAAAPVPLPVASIVAAAPATVVAGEASDEDDDDDHCAGAETAVPSTAPAAPGSSANEPAGDTMPEPLALAVAGEETETEDELGEDFGVDDTGADSLDSSAAAAGAVARGLVMHVCLTKGAGSASRRAAKISCVF
jgi:hypothetical protein